MSSPEEVLEVIEEGKANRHIAVTSELFLTKSLAQTVIAILGFTSCVLQTFNFSYSLVMHNLFANFIIQGCNCRLVFACQ